MRQDGSWTVKGPDEGKLSITCAGCKRVCDAYEMITCGIDAGTEMYCGDCPMTVEDNIPRTWMNWPARKKPSRIKRLLTFLGLAVLMTGCYGEFDIGARTPRRDPCSGRVEDKAVYVMPECPYPAVPPPPEGAVKNPPSLIPGR